MSQKSHKAQILPIMNQVPPITSNTTFHASFDTHLHGFSRKERLSHLGHRSALNFNGTNTYVAVISSKNLYQFGTGDFTIELWVKFNIAVTAAQQILCKRINSGGNIEVQASAAKIQASFGSSAGTVTATSTTSVLADTWYHIAVARIAGNAYLYVNAVQESTVASTQNINSISEVYMGRDAASAAEYLNGQLSDIRIWNYGRSVQEIKEYMNRELRGDETGLVGYWKLNEGEGIIANDYSVAGSDGLVYGTATWGWGRTVATLTPGGKFGNAVAVEESATNLLLDSLDLTTANWTKNATIAKSFVSPDNDLTAFKVTPTAMNNNISQTYTVDPATKTFTFSVWLRADVPHRATIKIQNNDASDNTSTPIMVTTDWQRFDVTKAFTATGKTSVIALLWPTEFDVATLNHVYAWRPQLEQKAFPTSHVVGTRPAPRLMYDARKIINPEEFTVSLWFYPVKADNTRYLFSANSGSNHRFNAFVHQTNQVMWEYYGGTAKSLLSSGTANIKEWNHAVFRYSKAKNEASLILNTVKNTWTPNLPATLAVFDNFVVGGDYNQLSNIFNGLIDEVRVDNAYITDDEVLAWYYAGPHYNPISHAQIAY